MLASTTPHIHQPFIPVFPVPEHTKTNWPPDIACPEAVTTIGAAFFGLGAAVDGHIRARMLVRNTGAAGQVDFSVSGGVGLTGTRSSGTNNNNAYLSAVQANVAHDTTVSHTIAVYAVFGAAAAGQLITGHGSEFTRKGP